MATKEDEDYVNFTGFSSNQTECSEDVFKLVTSATDIYDYILFGINFLSILANLYVCWTARHFYRRWSEMSHLLVLSMTVADATLCLTHQVRTVLVRFVVTLPQLVNVAVSISLMAVTWICWSASGFTVILLNLEKIVYFHWPLNYNDCVTLTKTNLAIGLCWVMCTVYAALLLATATYVCGPDICIVPHYDIYRTYVLLFCVAPALSSGVLSLYLWCTVRSKRRASSQAGCYRAGNQVGGGNNNVNLKQQLKTVVFIFTTTGWIVLSWVPARLYYIFLLESCSPYVVWFGWATNCLLSLSPMVNPFITVLIYPCYRRLTWTRMKSFENTRRKSSTTTTTEYRSVNKTPSVAI